MSTKTKFIFEVYGIGELRIKQRKFQEQVYSIDKSTLVVYESFTSWSQPCSFEVTAKGTLFIKDFKFSFNDIEYKNYTVIKESINGKELVTKGNFSPMLLDNSSGFLRVSNKIIHKHPI